MIELVVLLGTVGLLAIILAPALAATRGDAQVFQCRNNLRQLHAGWQMYSDENSGRLVPTAGTSHPNAPQWCYGRMDIVSESTDVARVQQGLLWPYVKRLSAYKCPADPKKNPLGQPTVRSFSMNAWMNPASAPSQQGLSAPGRIFRKQADISSAMSPAMCWVLAEEDHKTINDGWLIVSANPSSGPNNTTWIDVPAAYHQLSGALVFADGHVEFKRWRDRRLLTATGLFTPADPLAGDLKWMQERTTVPE